MTSPASSHSLTTTGPIGRWVLVATILASSMAFIDGSALNVALPAIQADLDATGGELLWVINGYLLMLAALILIGGSLGDKRGRKRMFMIGIGLFMGASLLCGLAPSIDFLIAARLLQGVGGAIMIPGSLAIISALFGPGERGRAIGTWSGATTIVTIAGPLLGGALADAGLWRGVFLINLPLGLVSLWVLRRHVPESRDEATTPAIDYLGATLAAVGLAALTYGFVTMPDLGLGAPRIWGSLVGGTAVLLLFFLVEARQAQPMMPLHLFRSRTFSGANLLTLFLYGALSAVSFFLSLNLVQAQGYRPTLAGFAFLPFVILLAALSRWAGGLVDRLGPRPPLIVGPALTGLGFWLLGGVGVTEGPAEYLTTFLPGILLFGVGMGVTVAPLTTAVMSALPTHYAGTASGINNAVARTASVLAIAILGALALVLFGGQLAVAADRLDLAPAARAALQAEAARLGEATVPTAVAAEQAPAVAAAIGDAFVAVFQIIMRICAGLAWLSAAMAAWLVEPRLAGQGD